VGCTIAFSVCNKSFKSLGLPSGRVKSREGLLGMIPTNIVPTMLCPRMQHHKNNGSYSLASLKKKLHLHNFNELKIKLLTWHYEISQDSISVK